MSNRLEEMGLLIDVYYSTISLDHHKSKDTFFCIETVRKPNEPVIFRAMHAGYHSEIGEYGWGSDCSTFGAAVEEMIGNLRLFIIRQHEWATKVVNNTEDWLSDSVMAAEILRRIEAANFDWV